MENKIKKYLSQQCSIRNWDCLPLINPTMRGWPDRTIIVPPDSWGPWVGWVETKDSSTRHSKRHIREQIHACEILHSRGIFAAFAVDEHGVTEVIKLIEYKLYHPHAIILGQRTLNDIKRLYAL